MIFGFRPCSADRTFRTLWVAHSFTALDKASLLRRADLVTEDVLVALLESVYSRDGG